jgi:hypothetical protein
MSQFKSVLIEDNLVGLLTDEITFGVQSAPKINYQSFGATSTSASNITFNCQIPSQNIVLDRNLLLSTDVNFTLQFGLPGANAGNPVGAGVPNGQLFFQYGLTSAFGSYPLNSLFTTVSSTINNVSVNSNTQDILALLLRLNDNPLISETNTNTAPLPDFYYQRYNDGLFSTNSPLSGFNNSSYDATYFGRGSLQLVVNNAIQYLPDGTAVTPGNTTFATNNVCANANPANAIYNYCKVFCSVRLVEPFIALSPYTNNAKNEEPGMFGINQISFNINIDQSCKRFFRCFADVNLNGDGTKLYLPTQDTDYKLNGTTPANSSNFKNYNNMKVDLGWNTPNPAGGEGYNRPPFQNTTLLTRYGSLTPSEVSRLKSSRNALSYCEYPRYLSLATQNGVLAPGATGVVLTSSNLQLSVIPDRIIIGVRIPMSSQTNCNTDSFLPITNINVLFNAQSGILSSATITDLYKLSRRSSGTSQNYYEFIGTASSNGTNINPASNTAGLDVKTIGSILCLVPSRDFALEDYLSASSSGAFNLQFQVTVNNTYPFSVSPEIIIITQNSGIFTTTDGVSSSEIGILNKETVLSTKMNEKPESLMMESEFNRLVGGRMHHTGSFNARPFRHHRMHNTKYSGMAHMSGGVVSGGVVSGGAVHHSRLHKYVK